MIIKRTKLFSIWGDTLDWAKKFTPKIPIGKNSKLYLLWPGTLVGAAFGFLKGLVSKFKHTSSGKDKEIDPHGEKVHMREPSEKQFSDVPMNLNFKELCNEIPGYEQLALLNSINFEMLKGLPEHVKKFTWRYFPSFLVLAKPEQISEYRQDFINKSGEDYSEILFAYGNELFFLWDFDKKFWSVQDWTYSPKKEWKIEGNIIKAIRRFFDPETNPLLANRIKHWREENAGNKIENFYDQYCKVLLSSIDFVIKYKM